MFVRSSQNPILKPDNNIDWRSIKVYNPTVLLKDGVCHLFFRAVGRDGKSRIGHAKSADGEVFTVDALPMLEPSSSVDEAGVEDPRIVKVDEQYFLTYTAYDGHTARQALAISTDLKQWEKIGAILPDWDIYSAGGFAVSSDSAMGDEEADRNWSKGGALFSEVINGEYLMIFGDRDLWLAHSADGRKWSAPESSWLTEREGEYFDNLHVEMGPPPIKTEYGWLVIYHGVDTSITYRLGYLLLDLKDPRKIIKRSELPIFEPQEQYELSGMVDISAARIDRMSGHRAPIVVEKLDKTAKKEDNNIVGPRVIFCCGAVLVDDILRIYYGAGDATICTASARLKEILEK